ncbi:hypothetical protein ACIPPJ_18770 [Streptomyces sp. NPDC086091]|uniref:hypothetical protein n=1 Tax=Streptomyces sp. NPDC086091 TaxID=3365751 RepID=UPI00381C944B
MNGPFRTMVDIEYVDAEVWSVLPPRGGESGPWEDWDDIGAWCREEAENLWLDHGSDPGPHGVDFVAGTLVRCAEAFSPPGTDHWLFLHHEHPTDLPLPVCVAVGRSAGPREETLRALAMADDPDAVEPPVVRRFGADRLGEGLSTFRYLNHADAPYLIASARYAWRVAEHDADVVMWTATDDTARIIAAAEDLERLAHALTLHTPRPPGSAVGL